jgi:hypothetical protein
LQPCAVHLGYLLLAILLAGCVAQRPKAKLVYFGFDNHGEKPEDVIRLAKVWGDKAGCPNWRPTIKKEEADYQVLFGLSDVNIIDCRGEVLYTGGQGVLYTPSGNPDGTGVSICKLTDKQGGFMTSDFSDRLARLECSNHRLKAALSALLCCAVAVVLMGARPAAQKVIEAEKIVLRDSAGNERGQFFTTENSSGIVFFNADGSKGAALIVGSALNGLMIADQNGYVRQISTVNLNESQWSVVHPGSKESQFEVIDNAQGTGLTFHNRANVVQIEMGVSSQGSPLNMSDSKGAVRATMQGEDLGFAAFTRVGKFQWTPGLENFSPEEREKIKALAGRLPK